ncbi:hypothetical protein CN227_18640 [Sinorhizobium meliloti]|uniref:hypothetical protein n=1 Tax=Rhizobium meliloti TaxID=382 RepID=UPI000FDB3297|nr:hypothetical protein [Sinorhizobium meliloti]RVE80123.1 hypothetical protein CN240_19355 [Sinorhizobium meliloti]RVG44213.1 hypothetical protein CN227_18640 [Sinorhizobium meliloti]
MRKNAERLLEKGSPAQKVDAQAVLVELGRVHGREEIERRTTVAAMGVPERVVNAFTSMPPTENEQVLLQVLLDNPDQSSQALSAKLGWGGQSWHLHFGKMCERREHLLWDAEPALTRDANFYCGILAIYSHVSHGFTMKPEVAEGLAAIGIGPSNRFSR